MSTYIDVRLHKVILEKRKLVNLTVPSIKSLFY